MKRIIVLVFVLFLLIPCKANAGLFSMNGKAEEKQEDSVGSPKQNNEIIVLDTVDKLIQKRLAEAHKLISEGARLIKKGEKRNNQTLITKGKIKKEIGQKQVQLLKEQTQGKKKQDQADGW